MTQTIQFIFSPAREGTLSRRLIFGALLGGLLASIPLAAFGQKNPRQAFLEYVLEDGLVGCPEQAALESAVSGRLGYVPWTSNKAMRIIVVSVYRDGQALVARVEARQGDGQQVKGRRVYRATTSQCAALMARVALSLSILIDPLSVTGPRPSPQRLREEQPTPKPNPPTPSSPAPPPPLLLPLPPEEPAAREEVDVARKWELSAAFSAGPVFGAAPAITGRFDLQVRFRWQVVSLAVEGQFDIPAETDLGGPSLGTQIIAGALAPCLHLSWFSGCAVVLAGALRATESGLKDGEPLTLPYVAAGGRLQFEVPVYRMLSLRAHGDILATLTRITLEESDTGTPLWSTPPVSGGLGVGVNVKFF